MNGGASGAGWRKPHKCTGCKARENHGLLDFKTVQPANKLVTQKYRRIFLNLLSEESLGLKNVFSSFFSFSLYFLPSGSCLVYSFLLLLFNSINFLLLLNWMLHLTFLHLPLLSIQVSLLTFSHFPSPLSWLL